jgi:threonyl-tRNA synthetase
MMTVILPDDSTRELPENSSALDLAKQISEGLARVVVVAKVNGEVQDIQAPLNEGDKVELLKADSAEGIDALRHSCEHVMATAVLGLFEGAQVTMGPKSHDQDFYYDFDIGRPFNPEDLEKITIEMKRLIKAKTPFLRETMSKDGARQLFRDLGQTYKDEILDWIPDDEVSVYRSGDFVDLCRGPHVPHAGHVKAFKLLSNSGSYWRADASRQMLQRITGTAFESKKSLDAHLFRIEEAKKRDHRRIGKELDLFLVSDRYDNHAYKEDADIEMLVTGSISEAALKNGELRADSILDDALLDGLQEIFSSRVIKMNGYNVSSHEADESRPKIDIKIRLSAGSVSSDQRKALQKLESTVSEKHEASHIRFIVDPHYTEEVGPGLVSWLPKGGRIRSLVEDQWRKMHFEGGYEIVYSPHLAKSDLWKVSGHWDFYRESMFSPMAIDGQEYLAKPMNCPFHVLMFKSRARSYRELPFRWAELGTVYRYELAGVLHGLMRVRGFTQDDAHIFCRWDQLDAEVDRVIGFILSVLRTFGFNDFEVNISTRPEKYVGSVEMWKKTEETLTQAVQRHDLPFVIDEGGGAFYGPKIDVKLKDCLGRMWQCSTLQLDFNNPERFGLSFTNREGKPEEPVMLHRALLGSIERFIGILIEHYAGAFPLWLAPEQVRVLPITDRHLDYAKEIGDVLLRQGMRVTVGTTNEKLGAKIRQAQLDKIPVMLVIGDKEVEDQGATIRMRDGENRGFKPVQELAALLLKEAQVPDSPVQ